VINIVVREDQVARQAKKTARKVKVAFTQQQWLLLDRLKAEKQWGRTREEIVHSVFRDYVKQVLGE
jgi:hypothetical protein